MDEKSIESRIKSMLGELADILDGYHNRYKLLFTKCDIIVVGSYDEEFAAVVLHYHIGEHCERVQSVFSPEMMLDDEYASEFTTAMACIFTAPVRAVAMSQAFPDEYKPGGSSD